MAQQRRRNSILPYSKFSHWKKLVEGRYILLLLFLVNLQQKKKTNCSTPLKEQNNNNLQQRRRTSSGAIMSSSTQQQENISDVGVSIVTGSMDGGGVGSKKSLVTSAEVETRSTSSSVMEGGDGSSASTVAFLTVAKSVALTSKNILLTLNPIAGIHSTKALSMSAKREVFKLVDPRGYSKPKSSDEAMKRIRANLNFFKLTYTSVPILFLISFVLSNPTLFLSIIICAGLWSAFFALGPDKVWQLGSVSLGRGEKLTILSSFTVIVVIFGGLITYAIYVVFGSAVIVGLHAAVKEPVEVDALEQLENEGQSFVNSTRQAAAGDIV